MEWWVILGNLAAVGTVAYLLDENLDHPTWLRGVPVLRYAVDVVLAAVLIPVVVLLVYAAVLFWQLVVGIAVVGVVGWLLFRLLRSGWDFLRPDGYRERKRS